MLGRTYVVLSRRARSRQSRIFVLVQRVSRAGLRPARVKVETQCVVAVAVADASLIAMRLALSAARYVLVVEALKLLRAVVAGCEVSEERHPVGALAGPLSDAL
jgi:hypothetical protein